MKCVICSTTSDAVAEFPAEETGSPLVGASITEHTAESANVPSATASVPSEHGNGHATGETTNISGSGSEKPQMLSRESRHEPSRLSSDFTAFRKKRWWPEPTTQDSAEESKVLVPPPAVLSHEVLLSSTPLHSALAPPSPQSTTSSEAGALSWEHRLAEKTRRIIDLERSKSEAIQQEDFLHAAAMKSQLTTAKDELRVLEVQCQQHEKMQAAASNVADLETAKARAAADEDFLHAPAVSDQLSAVKTQLRALEVRQKQHRPMKMEVKSLPHPPSPKAAAVPTTPTHEGRDQLHTSSTRASTEKVVDVRPFAALTNNEKQDQHDYMHYAAAAGEDFDATPSKFMVAYAARDAVLGGANRSGVVREDSAKSECASSQKDGKEDDDGLNGLTLETILSTHTLAATESTGASSPISNPGSPERVRAGSVVEVTCPSADGPWELRRVGRVAHVNNDGSYHIEYHDGSNEDFAVSRARIQTKREVVEEDATKCAAGHHAMRSLQIPTEEEVGIDLSTLILIAHERKAPVFEFLYFESEPSWRHAVDGSAVTNAHTIAAEDAKRSEVFAEDLRVAPTQPEHVELVHGKGVRIKFLLLLTYELNLWDWTTADVVRFVVKPATERHGRCRFADLDSVKAFTGPANTFISHAWAGKWGTLVAAACQAAHEDSVVWVDVFAVRQWPGNDRDRNNCLGVMDRCDATIVAVDPTGRLARRLSERPWESYELSEVLRSSMGEPTTAGTAAATEALPFFRLWCLAEIWFAVRARMGLLFRVVCVESLAGRRVLLKSDEAQRISSSVLLDNCARVIDVVASTAAVDSDHRLLAGFMDLNGDEGGSSSSSGEAWSEEGAGAADKAIADAVAAGSVAAAHCNAAVDNFLRGDASALALLPSRLFGDAFDVACAAGHVAVLDHLLEARTASAIQRTADSSYPIWAAASYGHAAVVERLLGLEELDRLLPKL